MDNRSADPQRHLTKEQDERRLRGLRALARLIVRAHLAAGDGGPASRDGTGAEMPGEEKRHAE